MAFFMIAGLNNASAKAKTYKSKVYATKQISHHYFKHTYIKYSQGGLIYTTRSLKHWSHKALNYRTTPWTTNQSVKVKKSNGKTAVYYYIRNKKNGIKGWIWRGSLVDSKEDINFDDPKGLPGNGWAPLTAAEKKENAKREKEDAKKNAEYEAKLAQEKVEKAKDWEKLEASMAKLEANNASKSWLIQK